VVEAFVQAAIDAERIGFDAVELHGAHGYLLDQFFWPGTNHRTGNYGGSLENRARFACEIVSGIRAKVSKDFPIIFRFSQWKQQDYTARLAETSEELGEFLSYLVNAGVDIFHCSQRRFWEAEFEGSDLNLAGWTKKLTGKDTITVGSVSLNSDFLPELGEKSFKAGEIANLDGLTERLERDEFDLVAVGRAIIANPDWVKQVQLGQFDKLANFEKKMLMNLVS
jgi:2,4-dienoyl-CoA reductase-like NADH-dependent reductase (Old Yellow Enzyme family)